MKPQEKGLKLWGIWCNHYMMPKIIPNYNPRCKRWCIQTTSFLPTTRLMHQIKWLNPHTKEEEAPEILIKKNISLRWHLEGDTSPILLTVHKKEATFQAKVLNLSWMREEVNKEVTFKRGEGLPLHLQALLLQQRLLNLLYPQDLHTRHISHGSAMDPIKHGRGQRS